MKLPFNQGIADGVALGRRIIFRIDRYLYVSRANGCGAMWLGLLSKRGSWHSVVASKHFLNYVIRTSMGLFEKYCARTFFFWMTRFLRTKYENVHIRYIAHHTEAHEVSEEHFFTKGESGGTICSSAYEFALNIINRDYPPDRYNIYPIHFSDGDNLTSDNEKCVKLVEQLCQKSQMFGYSEVNQYGRNSTMMNAFGKLDWPVFRRFVIRDKTDIYAALKHFFSRRDGVRSA